MKKILCLLVSFFALQAYGSDFFVITNEPVFAKANNAVEAQEKAIHEGEVKAFTSLMDKLIVHPADKGKISLPNNIPTLVQDVSFSKEERSSQTYQGLLTVRFKAEPIRAMLSQTGIEYITRLPEPMLVVPVFEQEGKTLIYEAENPLYRVWRENDLQNSLFSLSLPKADEQLVQKGQEAYQNGTYAGYKTLLNENNLTATLILTIQKVQEQYHITTKVLPENSAPEAHIDLTVSDDREVLEKVLLDLSKDTVRSMTKKWLYLAQETNTVAEIYHFYTPLENMTDLGRVQKKIKELNFAQEVSIKSFSDKRLFVDITFKGSIDELSKKLALNQITVMQEPQTSATGEPLYEFVLTESSAVALPSAEVAPNTPSVPDLTADTPSVPDLTVDTPSVPDLTADTPSVPDLTVDTPSVPDLTADTPSVPDLTNDSIF